MSCYCGKKALFGNKIGVYHFCEEHKNEKSIYTRKCIDSLCLTRPRFNYALLPNPLFCKNHKTNDMIDIIRAKSEKTKFRAIITNKVKNCFRYKTFKELKEIKRNIYHESLITGVLDYSARTMV